MFTLDSDLDDHRLVSNAEEKPVTELSRASTEKLAGCDMRLRYLVEEVNRSMPCLVMVGHRGKEEQEAAFAAGKSKLHWPESKHNATPSRAVDLAPLPFDPKDSKRLLYFIGFLHGKAAALGIEVRLGVDFNGNGDVTDDHFFDGYHVELKD